MQFPYTCTGSLCPSFLPDRHVCLPVKRPYAIALFGVGDQSTGGRLWKPPLRFWRRPPQSNCPPSSVRASRVRPQTAKGPYFKDGSTRTGARASKPPAYPTHRMTKVNAKLQERFTGSFRPIAGNRHLHRYYNFTGIMVETASGSLHHSCRSELTRQGISLP